MSQAAGSEKGRRRRGVSAHALDALRFLATDRMGLFLLLWTANACVLRPVLLEALDGRSGWPHDAIREAFGPLALAHLASVIEWVSFAGMLALAVLAHVRYSAFRPRSLEAPAYRYVLPAAYVCLLTAGYLFFLWKPISVFTVITHDSLIFFDSTYRISAGLVPSNDFPTALGAVQLYLPAFASWLIGGYGGSVELASVWVAAALGLGCAVVGARRLPVAMTASLAGIVFLITVPAAMLENWGGPSQTLVDGKTEILADNLTWAMFYNRWGWAALIPMFMALAPTHDRQIRPHISEIIVLASLLVFLFWLKISYFLAGVAAAAVYAWLNPAPLRTLATGAAASGVGIVGVGLITGNLVAYVNDILMAGQVSGARTASILGLVRRNLPEMLFSLAPLGVLAAIGRLRWRDGLIALFMLAVSLFVINQNGQLENMSTLVVLAAYGAVRVMAEGGVQQAVRVIGAGVFAILAGSHLLDRGLVLIDQAYAGLREQIREPSRWAAIPAFRHVYVPERESMFQRVLERSASPEAQIKNVGVSGQFGRRQELRQGEYMETLLAGIEDLRSVARPGDSVTTLDMTNPFPFLMNLRAPRGGWLTLHHNRTIGSDVHPSPEVMFADADHVMIARMSMVQPTADLMRELYGAWLDQSYSERVETLYWTRWSHRRGPP